MSGAALQSEGVKMNEWVEKAYSWLTTGSSRSAWWPPRWRRSRRSGPRCTGSRPPPRPPGRSPPPPTRRARPPRPPAARPAGWRTAGEASLGTWEAGERWGRVWSSQSKMAANLWSIFHQWMIIMHLEEEEWMSSWLILSNFHDLSHFFHWSIHVVWVDKTVCECGGRAK